MQTQAAAGFVGAEGRVRGVIEQQGGLELGAGAGVLDEADAVAQVEALGWDGLAVRVKLLGRREQTAQAAAEIGGAGEVGLGNSLAAGAFSS